MTWGSKYQPKVKINIGWSMLTKVERNNPGYKDQPRLNNKCGLCDKQQLQ